MDVLSDVTLRSWLDSPNLICVMKRYVELVNPDSGDTVPYEYPVLIFKNGDCTDVNDRERAIYCGALTKLKKDGLLNETTDTTFYPEWSDKMALIDPYVIDKNATTKDFETTLYRCYVYEREIRVKYYLVRRRKPDEAMTPDEIATWRKMNAERYAAYNE